MPIRYALATLCLSLSVALCAQTASGNYEIVIRKAAGPITLDGVLDEPDWQVADVADGFYMNRPMDTSYAARQTVVRVTFDDKFLYVSAVCYQLRSEYTISSFKRDFEGGTGDVFAVNIDPFNDQINGFHFAVSPFNVQREGLIDNGQNLSNFWDNKWESAVTNHDDRWELEMAIPFKTLRYKRAEGTNVWRINFARATLQKNEVSSWHPVPRNFFVNGLAFTGRLLWADAPPVPGMNISIIPYIAGRVDTDFPRDPGSLQPSPSATSAGYNFGADVKIGITPSLNLDLTFNPDFSQVEVDRQVTNLSRFELFFPERRQFFLENADLFAFWGFPDTRPFFSRRVGLAYNPRTGNNEPIPILAGARLSGKLNEDWRVGLLNMQTKEVDFGNNEVLPAANYTVATLQRKVFQRSVLGAVFANKQNFLSGLPAQPTEYQPYNRVGGLEFNYFSPDNVWETESYFHHAILPDKPAGAFSGAQFIGYNTPHFRVFSGYQYIGQNYRTETGFIPRPGVQTAFLRLTGVRFLTSRAARLINSVSLTGGGNYTFDLAGRPLDHDTGLELGIDFKDFSSAGVSVTQFFTYLQDSRFDPTNPFFSPDPDKQAAYAPLPEAGYEYLRWQAFYQSSQRYDVAVEASVEGGQFFNGHRFAADLSLGYRLQPYGTFSAAFTYNDIALPEPYNTARFYLIGPRAELAFSRTLFLSAFFQYNTQTNNMNINARLQWRFRPVSDLFLVYTDNYFATGIPAYMVSSFSPKNRSLVFKATYWLNV